VCGAAYVDARRIRVHQAQPRAAVVVIALCHALLHHSLRNVAPGTGAVVLPQSLKRDVLADSPLSMTSPKTNLTRGHCAPLRYRPSPAPHSTLPHSRTRFLRGVLRPRAEYTPCIFQEKDHEFSKQGSLRVLQGGFLERRGGRLWSSGQRPARWATRSVVHGQRAASSASSNCPLVHSLAPRSFSRSVRQTR
jgi:hypothetical protein